MKTGANTTLVIPLIVLFSLGAASAMAFGFAGNASQPAVHPLFVLCAGLAVTLTGTVLSYYYCKKTISNVMSGLAEENSKLTAENRRLTEEKENEKQEHENACAEMAKGFETRIGNLSAPLSCLADFAEKMINGESVDKIPASFAGDSEKICLALNFAVDAIRDGRECARRSEKIQSENERYGDILDAVPFPVSVTDGEHRWLYLNKAAADMTGMTREEAIGKFCGESITAYASGIQHFEVSGGSLYDGLGNEVGRIEIIQDDTIIIEADKYSGEEVVRLAKNLGDLSKGFLDLDFNVGEGNEYTVTERENFSAINENLKVATEGIRAMVEDVKTLAEEAVKGDLSYRADAARHGGEFASIMNGVNETLDSVIAPISEASSVLQEMAKGNLQIKMEGEYRGDHAEIKEALNGTIENIRSYISEIASVLQEIGNGNLDQSITADYKGDFIAIKDSLNNIIVSLSQVLGDIHTAADQVTVGSKQVSDASQALSQGSTEQASTIQQLTASITEIANQTRQNAIHANEANELADNAVQHGLKGNGRMRDMLSSMDEINESSKNISKIIKVIDDIAFQTNILALNAAVEAARAGQHGKGFAVVAEEVRNLAARSANAANETTSLIEGSIDKVRTGSRLAQETAEALEEIVGGVEKAAALVSEIAQASNDQASGITQINLGIEQVSQVVQNNSATAEESAAASEELFGQSEILKQMVASFRLQKATESDGFAQARLLTEGMTDYSAFRQKPEGQKIMLEENELARF